MSRDSNQTAEASVARGVLRSRASSDAMRRARTSKTAYTPAVDKRSTMSAANAKSLSANPPVAQSIPIRITDGMANISPSSVDRSVLGSHAIATKTRAESASAAANSHWR
jgi:hypothetical protein